MMRRNSIFTVLIHNYLLVLRGYGELLGKYSVSWLSKLQEPHPQPPPRKQGGGYDVSHVIRKRYSGSHKNPTSNPLSASKEGAMMYLM